MKFHKDGTLPSNRQIFVFGSNLAGIHGAGAAKAAIQFGARMGRGVGLHGDTYAIPTKDHDLKTLSLDKIEPYVDRFIKTTLMYPQTTTLFFVTRIGCGLAGYTDKQIAPLFKRCGNNCSFAEEWKPHLS